MSYASILSGASGRPRTSPSSFNARERAAKSVARFSLWRVNASFALWLTIWRRRLPSPRAGTEIRTRLPRTRESHSSTSAWSVGHVGTRIRGGTSSRSMYSSRRKFDTSRGVSMSSTLSTTHPRRPITRPPRTKKTWTAASRSSSSIPTISRSSFRPSTISWLSMALRAAASWSRSFAARSNSSPSAACRISASSRLRTGR